MERVYDMIEMIQKAYPQGIDEVYHDLIGCLKEEFTTQNLAALLSYVTGLDMNIVKRDIMKNDLHQVSEHVIQKLSEVGFKQGQCRVQ